VTKALYTREFPPTPLSDLRLKPYVHFGTPLPEGIIDEIKNLKM
jgi:hypothetical protein